MTRSPFSQSVLLACLLASTSVRAATLSVTPSAISNTYSGAITLQVGGLTNGEAVTIDKFLDANTNGVIDGNDLLEQRFRLTDGQASLIGGIANVNVPGDSNPAVSNITTVLNYERIEIEHISGSYLFKLSSPTARFTSVTNAFNITDTAYLQSFTGQVRSNGTATVVANAVVVLLGVNNDGRFVSGTVADNSGNYTLKAAPGTYQLAAFKSNFVGDFTAPPVTIGAGVSVTTNINAIPATQTISGRVADAGNTNKSVGGIMLFLGSADGFVALSFTDTNGIFNAPVTAGIWNVEVNDSDATVHGYVRSGNSPDIITTTGSVTGVSILLPKGTAMFYGSVKDDLGNPLPGFSLNGQDQDTYQYQSDGVSDANGNYAVVALAGNWNADFDNSDPGLANYVVSGNIGTTLLANGQAVRQDFLLKPATNHITGYLRDNLSNPIAGVSMYAYATINGTNFNAGNATTDASGNYTLNVVNGNWQVGVNCGCSDCDGSLTAMGYQCVNNQQVTISGNNGVANFIASPCGALEITTTSLPDAEAGAFYNVSLLASGCDEPFNWSLSPGSAPLPLGMSLNSSGNLFGNPATNGTFNFSVRVTDNSSATDDQALSLIVTMLQVTTTNLPNGTQDVFYATQLNASGGQPPYHWYLPGGTGTLPPGTMNLSDSGSLSGTPTAAGTYNFWVAAFDNVSSVVATQYLSFTIIAGAPPLQVTTTNLPNGTQDVFYTQQLNTSGGQPPYNWYLPDGTVTLPPGTMNLSTNGILSGTPTSSGTYNFWVGVWGNTPNVATQYLSLTINPPSSPLQVTTTSLPNGTNGAFYSQTIQASGGQAPYSWSIANYSADPPANLTLATNGVLSGTLTTAGGPFYFDVAVTDGAANTAYQTLSVYVVNPPLPPLLITNLSLPNGNVGAAYSAQLGATGGQQPYQCWSLALGSASLPAGLSLDCSGLVSGTPTTNKTSTFKVQVMDANSTTTNKILSLTINPRPVLGSPNWLTNRFQMRLTGASNQNYTVQMSTNLSSTNWSSLFITNNPTTNSFLLTDPNATNKQRSYRILIGP